MMKKFIQELKEYKEYISYATKANLKDDVAGSYLNWLWWILDPLFFMMIYSFVALIVFGKGEPYFPIFVFIGLNTYNFFSKVVQESSSLIRKRKSILKKVYLPKYMLVVISILENLFKTAVAFSLIIILMPLYHVPLSWRLIQIIPIFATLVVYTFGIATIVMHYGVFFSDLSHFVHVILRLFFYLSGIFYSIPNRVAAPYDKLVLTFNPTAFIIDALRKSILEQSSYNHLNLFGILAVGLLLSAVGIRLISKNENTYIKVTQ